MGKLRHTWKRGGKQWLSKYGIIRTQVSLPTKSGMEAADFLEMSDAGVGGKLPQTRKHTVTQVTWDKDKGGGRGIQERQEPKYLLSESQALRRVMLRARKCSGPIATLVCDLGHGTSAS